MKTVGESGRIAYRFHIFGWHITISNCSVRFRPGAFNRGVKLDLLFKERRRIADDRCERCGRDVIIYGRLYRLLPPGHPDRLALENVRFYCNSCYKAAARLAAEQKQNQEQKGGEQ